MHVRVSCGCKHRLCMVLDAHCVLPVRRKTVEEMLYWLCIVPAVARTQVNVKEAHMEEILPAARLLSRATAVTPLDYERAKATFLVNLISDPAFGSVAVDCQKG